MRRRRIQASCRSSGPGRPDLIPRERQRDLATAIMSETVQSPAPAELGVAASISARIRAVDTLFMQHFNRGDAEGAARAVYTADAVIGPPGSPMIQGRDDIASFWKGAQQQLGIEACDLVTVQLLSAGEFVHQLGRATLTLAGGQQAAGKYAVLWKEEGGEMKWHVDIWNMDA
jgi:ketosteroid isomerase-like protein